jgi:GTPase SAR1 family protein
MSILSQKQEMQFQLMRELLEQSLEITEKLNYEDESIVLRERINRLKSAALFVIVGEVKSGKSTFVNALLRTDICEVAPDPCTSKIQEIVYGNENDIASINANCERVTLNEEVLREISVVDTPGTNSIVKNHQIITEKYVPQSDLVIFVFSSTNPHTRSAWDFLELIQKEWRRKVIFILQQSDRASSNELIINEEKVKQYARERGIQKPMVFLLSAKHELEGKSDSGFQKFRQYIQESISNGEVWKNKVESIRNICSSVAQNIENNLKKERESLKEDIKFYENLILKLESRKEKISSLQGIMVNGLCGVYNHLIGQLEKDFTEGLNIGTVIKRSIPFLRDKDIKDWSNGLQTEFKEKAEREIKAESFKVSKNISSELQNLFEELNRDIEKRYSAINKSGTGLYDDRDEILKNLEDQLDQLKNSKLFSRAAEADNIGNFAFAGGGIAALGAVIAAVTHIAIFDITGGILAVAGAALVGITLFLKRSGIIKEFSKNVKEAKNEFKERINAELDKLFSKVFHELEFLIKQFQTDTKKRIEVLDSSIKEANTIHQNSNKLGEL